MPYLIQDGAEWVKSLYTLIMPFTMSGFTMISGYFVSHKPLKSRINSYLIPCLLFSAVNILLARLSPISYVHDRPITELGYAMWYLYVVFVYNVITPLAMKKLSACRMLILSVLLCLATCRMSFFNSQTLQVSRLISHYPFFLIGIILREKGLLRFRQYKKVRYISLACFLFVLLANMAVCHRAGNFHFLPAFDHPIGIREEMYALILCSVLSISLLLFVPDREYFFTKLGKYTITPYLLHMCLLFPICWKLAIPLIGTWYGLVVYMAVTPLMCLPLFTGKANERLAMLLRRFHI